MKKQKQTVAASLIVTVMILLGCNVYAQQIEGQLPQEAPKASDFTDDEYNKFVDINVELIPIQQGVQDKMIAAIKDEGIEAQRFQELAQAQQQGSLTDASDDPDEIAKFNKAGQKVMEIQREVQTKAQNLIQEKELSVQKFQQISMAYNQNQEVRTKVDALISKKMKEKKD